MRFVKGFLTSLIVKKDFLYTSILVAIGLYVIYIWFSDGTMLAIGEEGLPFYDSSRTLRLYTSAFYDTGLGISGVFNIPRIPLYAFASLLQYVGFASWQIQAVVYSLLILTALLSVPKLIKETINPRHVEVSYIASAFYLLNLFTLSQVFIRFVSSLFFLWAYLPLFLLLWIKYLKYKKWKYLLYLLVSSFAYSATFVILSPIITLWICAGLYVLIRFFTEKNKVSLLVYSFIGLLLWIITNSWWLYPFLQLSNSGASVQIDAQQNLVSLADVSSYYPNSELIYLRHDYMLGPSSPVYEFYSSSVIYNISYIVLIAVVLGIGTSILSLYRKQYFVFQRNGIILFLVLLFTGWFISKGTNPPFGKEFFEFLFTNISVTQIFRNPYEKFGSVFAFSYSVFFALGIMWLVDKFNIMKYVFLFLIIFLSCGYLVKPVWDGTLFKQTTRVSVPSYYYDVNNILKKSENDDTRIFQLPFLKGSAITYDWNYTGEDPTEFLFDATSVSRTLSNSEIDEFYLKLNDQNLFRKNENFTNILAIMNVQYVILHSDYKTVSDDKSLVMTNSYMEGIDDTRKYITSWSQLKHIENFGKLEVYEIPKEKIPGRLYISDTMAHVKDLDEAFVEFTKNDFNPKADSVFIEKQNSNVFPLATYTMPQYEVETISKEQYRVHIKGNEDPYILILANNFLPQWISRIGKEEINTHFEVNGFANGWIIDKKGDYSIDVLFKVWPWE